MKYDIEKALNISIPEEIKKIIEIKKELSIMVDGELSKFIVLSPDEVMEAYKEQCDLFGYDFVENNKEKAIWAIYFDDYLCLNYKNCDISVVYWSTERATESKTLAVFELYSSYEDFAKDC